MIGNADRLREDRESKFERLKKILKEFQYYPVTGYGKVLFEIDILDHQINMVTPKVDIKPDDEELSKVSVITKVIPERKSKKEFLHY